MVLLDRIDDARLRSIRLITAYISSYVDQLGEID